MKNILVIEDELPVLESLVEMLEYEDFNVFDAHNGLEGLKLALEHKPDLIISDIMMPELDGFGVLTAIRSNPETQMIPFIFLTAKTDHSSRRQGIVAGADDYLTKPFTSVELMDAITVRLERQAVMLSDISRQIDDLHLLRQLDQELSQRLSADWAITIMMDWALRHTNAKIGIMGIIDQSKRELRLEYVYMRQIMSPPRKGDVWALDDDRIISIMSSTHPILIGDIRKQPFHRVIDPASLSVLGLTLGTDDRILGMLILESDRLDAFKQDHLDFMAQMANRAAVAIEHSQLFQELILQKQQELELRAIFGRFVSNEVADAIRTNRIQLTGERSIVSVLFCDIRDFTGFSEQHTPEQVLAMLNEFIPVVVKGAHMNGGNVNKFGGDSTLIIFGAPISLEDCASQAVRTALQIRSNLKHLNLERTKRGELAIQIGMGINTGEVVAGIVGAEDRQEYTVIGDTVNLASRIQALNKRYPKYDILISEQSYVALDTHKKDYRYVDLGEQVIRGKSEQVKVLAVIDFAESSNDGMKFQNN